LATKNPHMNFIFKLRPVRSYTSTRSKLKGVVRFNQIRMLSLAEYNDLLKHQTTDRGIQEILARMKIESVSPDVETYKLVVSFFQKTWPERREQMERDFAMENPYEKTVKTVIEDIEKKEGPI